MIRASEVVFILTTGDVVDCAKQMGVAEELITDDVLEQVKKSVESAWEGWREVIKAAISHALK